MPRRHPLLLYRVYSHSRIQIVLLDPLNLVCHACVDKSYYVLFTIIQQLNLIMKTCRKLFLALAVVAGLFTTQKADAQKVDIMASYGGYTQMDCTDMHDGWHGVNNGWGALNVGVDFHITPKIAIGPSYTFSSTTTKGDHHSSISYHGIMMNLRYKYWRNSIVTLYAHGGIGCVVSHMQPYHDDTYNKTYFGVQIVPIGAEVGIAKKWTMYGELGFGVQGILQIGFKYTL